MPSRASKVLILSPHSMTAALVGWYVELAKLEPAFAGSGEHPEEALARVKPVLVVLIDAEFEEAMSDLLVARAVRRGVGVALFGNSATDAAAREWAERNDVLFFQLPVELEAFGRVLDRAARQQERRVVDRRIQLATDRAVDGTLLFFDNVGSAWYVYDRRGGDRRFDRPSPRAYRAFVNETGIERRCEMNDVDFAAREPEALGAQLARAAQVPANHS